MNGERVDYTAILRSNRLVSFVENHKACARAETADVRIVAIGKAEQFLESTDYHAVSWCQQVGIVVAPEPKNWHLAITYAGPCLVKFFGGLIAQFFAKGEPDHQGGLFRTQVL